MLPGADWRVEIHDRAGGVLLQGDRAAAFTNGCELRADRIIPTTCFTEVRDVVVPFGARLLRSIRSAQAMYHTDAAALTLADRLIYMDFKEIFDIGLLLQLQMRAGVDTICGQLQVSPSTLALLDGRPMVGNITLDRELSSTNDYIDMVGLGTMLPALVSGVGDVIGSIGLPMTWSAELATNTEVEIIPYHLWGYSYLPGRHDLESGQISLRCLSPVTATLYRPELNIPGSVLIDTPKVFSTLAPTSLLPWDEWAIDSGQMMETEPFGALRCIMALSGQRIVVAPGLRQVHMSGNADPVTRPILTRYGRVGPRVPWQTPTMENSIADPFWFTAAPLGYQIRAIPVGDVYDFIRPGPMHAYQTNARMDNLPPLNAYNNDMITHLIGTAANPRPVAAYPAAIGSYNAGTYGRTNRVTLAGVRHLGPGFPVLTPAYDTTDYGESLIRVMSGQASSNTTWMRNTPALEAANRATQVQFRDRTRQITGPNGAPPGPAFTPPGTPADGMRLTSYGCNLHTVPFGDNVPPGEQMIYTIMQSPTWCMRWKTWYTDIKPGAMPVLLASLEQYSLGPGIPILTGMPSGSLTASPPLPAQNALTKEMRARIGLPAYPVDTGSVTTFEAEPMRVPTTTMDPRHVTTGYSAAQGSFEMQQEHGYPPRPLRTYDPAVEVRRLQEQIALLQGENLAGHGAAKAVFRPLRPQAGF
jgi:hypothetical protein